MHVGARQWGGGISGECEGMRRGGVRLWACICLGAVQVAGHPGAAREPRVTGAGPSAGLSQRG